MFKSFVFLGTVAVGSWFGLTAQAQKLPPIPSKTLPDAAPTRSIVAPESGFAYGIRTETKESDSDAVESAPVIGVLGTSAASRPSSEFFTGKARKAAKISIASGRLKSYRDLNTLLADLPSNATMEALTPPISTSATSGRVPQENKNVRVRCWLYAASREDDNDFHLILGGAPGLTPARFMTMELSGLPPMTDASHAKLKAARDAFTTFFQSNRPGSNYDFYNPPIPVLVEGSLFFDMSHARGTPPGPKSLRSQMPTIWEVHPITRIVFEPTP